MKKLNRKEIILYILLLLFIIGLGFGMVRKPGDLDVFVLGSQRLISKQVITVPEHNHFTYPPFFAVLMIPLGLLPFSAAKILWYIINWGCLLGCVIMIKKLVYGLDEFKSMTNKKMNWIMFFSVLISFKYILSVFENKQFDLLVFFFCLAGLYYIFHKRDILGSGLLAIGISIKCTPLLFILYLLLKKKSKIVTIIVIFCLVFAFLPDLLFYNHQFSYFFDWVAKILYYHPVIAKLAEPGYSGARMAPGGGTNYLNQSLGVLVYRMFSENAVKCINNIAQLNDRTVSIIKYLIFMMVFFVPFIILRKRFFKSFEEYQFPVLMETAAIFCLMVLFSPMSSKPHFNTLLYGNSLLVAIYALKKDKALFWAVLLPIFLMEFNSRDIVGKYNAGYLYQLGITTISALLTYSGLIWMYWKYYIKNIH